MLRLVAFLLVVLVVASGLAWLADRPGQLVINWENQQIETSVFHAVVIVVAVMALLGVVWSLLRHMWDSPAILGRFINRRRQQRGLDALSSGMIAVGAGDRANATRYAIQARKSLPNEPLTQLLRAQAAQLSGDRATARRIFESMLASPDTEQLGLRGLFVEAQRENAPEPALHYSQRALELNPKLAWPIDALFDLQCRQGNWAGALETLATAKRNGHIDKPTADRRRAVLLTAQAQELEDNNPAKALTLASEAHRLAVDLIPAAAIAGRILASQGNTAKAAKVLQSTWKKAPHPDLATAYAYARIGDSPRDRLDRVKKLAGMRPHAVESPIAVAKAAIDAHAYDEARHALSPLLDNARLTQAAATLMARIEGEQHGDKGRVREWLARAVPAQRDAVWTADGVVAERWAAVSPVTGQLDAFVWKVPVERVGDAPDEAALHDRLNELVALGQEQPADLDLTAEPEIPAQEEKPEKDISPAPAVATTKVEPVKANPEPAAEPTPAPPETGEGEKIAAGPGPEQADTSSQKQEKTPVATVATDERDNKTIAAATPAKDAGSDQKQERKATSSTGAKSSKAVPAEASASKGRSKPEKTQEHTIFVSPRAPDDPGADDEEESAPAVMRPYRAV